MRGSRTIGFRVRGIAIVLAVLVPLAVLPAAASAQEDDPPFINSASISPSSLSNGGGTVTVTAHVVDDVGIDDVHAEVSGDVNTSVAMTYAGSDNWTGTFDAPANPAETPLYFYVTVYATDTNAAVAELFAGEGSVAETTPVDPPPIVWDPSVTPTSLPYTGGDVDLAVSAWDLRGISEAYALVSTGPGDIPDHVALEPVSADRFEGTFAAPMNTSNSAVTYFVNFVALDDIGQESSAEGAAFTVDGRPTGSLVVRPGDRDFEKVKLGRTAQRNLVLSNTGAKGTFPVTGVLVATGAPFSLVGQTATGLPFTLKPGETKTFTIAFAPTALGVATGRVDVVRSDGKQAGLGAALTGRGT